MKDSATGVLVGAGSTGGTEEACEELEEGRIGSSGGEAWSTSGVVASAITVGVESGSTFPDSALAKRASSCMMTLFKRSTSASDASKLASSLFRLWGDRVSFCTSQFRPLQHWPVGRGR